MVESNNEEPHGIKVIRIRLSCLAAAFQLFSTRYLS
jgi:hypothetical protein